ncbi:MAG: hypothetical protein QOE59_5375 [Actinomycetota bacterium]|nr:hypothetical protein [Actinomycetota bacterium]
MLGGVDDGLYESLRTAGLERHLQALPAGAATFGSIDKAAAPDVLARHVAEIVRRSLSAHDDEPRRQALVNGIVELLEGSGDDTVVTLEQLLAVSVAPGVHRVVRPAMPLSDTALLTDTKDEPSLGAELQAEIASADRVDLLCAFVKWHGMRLLSDQFDDLKARGKPLRVLTTTYLGGTERHAVDELVHRYGAEVKIRFEEQSTRLQAKAWLFRRRSGFDTGYVGSSNLSKSALVDGLEWNVRISSVATPALDRKSKQPSTRTGTTTSSGPTTRTATPTSLTAPSAPGPGEAQRSRTLRPRGPAPARIRNASWNPSRPSAPFTTATGTVRRAPQGAPRCGAGRGTARARRVDHAGATRCANPVVTAGRSD